MSGPVARALAGSYLAPSIQRGVQAIPGGKRKHISDAVRSEFADSLDLDEASRARHHADARWDYLLGHAPSSQIVGIETHPAETSHVSRVIEKRTASLGHLRGQLAAGHHVAAWYWAASGRIDFVPHEKTLLRLSEHGIQFVGGRVEAKHLAQLQKRPSTPTRRGNGSRK